MMKNFWNTLARPLTGLTAWSLLAVAVYAVLFFAPLFFQGKTMSAFDLCYFRMDAYRELKPAELQRPSNDLLSDPVLMMQPWDRLMAEGRIPFPWLWNPYAGCGAPLLANGQSSPFFPLKWLAVLAGSKMAFGIFCFLKTLLAGLLTWLFLRTLGVGALGRTFGALCFMGCGFMIAWLQYPVASAAMWLPLLLIGCEHLTNGRQRAAFLALAGGVALSGLAGHPETTFHSLMIAGVYLLIRMMDQRRFSVGESSRLHGLRLLAWFAAACLVGLLIAAVQIIPMAEYIFNSADFAQRQGSARPWIADRWFFMNAEYARREWLAYIVPDTWGNPSLHGHWWNPLSNYCESAGYVSVGALLLAIAAWTCFRKDPRVRVFCCLQALSLLFILQITLLRLDLQALPIFQLVANKRLLFVFCFASAALAALMVDHFQRDAVIPRRVIIILGMVAAALFAFAGSDYVQRFAANPYPWIRVFGRHQMEHLAWALLPWLALGAWPVLKPGLRPFLLAGLILISTVDLFLVHYRFNPFIKPDRIYPETPAIAFLRSQPAPVRVLPLHLQIGPNLTGLYAIEDPRIYDALTFAWQREFLDAIGAQPRWNIVSAIPRQLASLASIQYFWTSPGDAAPGSAGLPLVYADAATRIYRNTNALPRAYVAQQWQGVSSTREALEIIQTNGDPRFRPVCIEGMDGGSVKPSPGSQSGTGDSVSGITPARISTHQPHRVLVELSAANQGILVLNDLYAPGWTARSARGHKTIQRVNGIFRGVALTPEDRWIEFRYRPMSFVLGAALSLLGLGALGLVLAVKH